MAAAAPTPCETKNNATVNVTNLGVNMTNDRLKKMFEGYGTITSYGVLNDDEPSKRFGFVTFDDSDAADEAVIELNGQLIDDNRRLRVRRTRKSENNRDKPRSWSRNRKNGAATEASSNDPATGALSNGPTAGASSNGPTNWVTLLRHAATAPSNGPMTGELSNGPATPASSNTPWADSSSNGSATAVSSNGPAAGVSSNGPPPSTLPAITLLDAFLGNTAALITPSYFAERASLRDNAASNAATRAPPSKARAGGSSSNTAGRIPEIGVLRDLLSSNAVASPNNLMAGVSARTSSSSTVPRASLTSAAPRRQAVNLLAHAPVSNAAARPSFGNRIAGASSSNVMHPTSLSGVTHSASGGVAQRSTFNNPRIAPSTPALGTIRCSSAPRQPVYFFDPDMH